MCEPLTNSFTTNGPVLIDGRIEMLYRYAATGWVSFTCTVDARRAGVGAERADVERSSAS
jgi:hypothetical protein